ncbi:translation initiation factor IF-2 associated domain-containing protein, partial [Sphingosinicella sp. YJ22]|uniref:translation initiation factor IF-2 associated domain-containing protein n=1 Tax=Sphingosinicella sp. YJ22 TaxID=1104780 RepID=UPI001A9C9595
MSDTTDKPKLGARAPLGIKRTVEAGKVKQSFSHGRSNTVVVEVKKRRVLGRPGETVEAPKPEVVEAAPAPAPAPEPAPRPAPPKRPVSNETPQERQARLLREAEEQRMQALEEARRREDRDAKAATEDEKRRAEENRKAEEAAAEAARQAAEEARKAAEAEAAAPKPAETAAAPAAREDRPVRFTPVARPAP